MARTMGSHSLPNKGATDVWLTPPHITEALGPFDLDPCHLPNPPWETASTYFCEETDGLTSPWNPDAFVWCNPPYSNVWAWLAKLAAHPAGGIALIFARTETRGFFSEVWGKADGLLFIEGRLSFCRPDGSSGSSNAGAPSVLVGYGAEACARLANRSIKGRYVSL